MGYIKSHKRSFKKINGTLLGFKIRALAGWKSRALAGPLRHSSLQPLGRFVKAPAQPQANAPRHFFNSFQFYRFSVCKSYWVVKQLWWHILTNTVQVSKIKNFKIKLVPLTNVVIKFPDNLLKHLIPTA